MLRKTRSGADKVKVSFVLPSRPGADHVHLVGDFNAWQASTPMKRDKEGRWRATVELEPGRDYRFRYLVDGNEWVNDEAADRYEPNPFGADNCVLTTPVPVVRDGSKARASRAVESSAKGAAASAAGQSSTRSAGGASKSKSKAAGPEKSGSGKSPSKPGPRRGKGE